VITDSRHSTVTMATLANFVRPSSVVPCHWCGFTRFDHFGNAAWADSLLRCPQPSVVGGSFGERQLREPTYQPAYR